MWEAQSGRLKNGSLLTLILKKLLVGDAEAVQLVEAMHHKLGGSVFDCQQGP
jgi:hypothetical protein